jgi:alpha-tubulin suppressor-like RCC1 family protein
MNIVLIDKRVSRYEDIVAAIDPAVAVGVVFDYYEDTFDTLKARMRDIGLTNTTTGNSVGLIQHNYRTPMFSMLASADVAPVAQVESQDPDLARWTQFRDFIGWCKTEMNTAHFDMMACALYSDTNWKYVIDTLSAQTGVTVRASTDNTGSATLGGNWFLESHIGVNLKTVYFTELIEEYWGVLYLEPYDIRDYSTKGFATGSIQSWGRSDTGWTSWGYVNSGVVAVYSTSTAFAALKSDGSVQVWGNVNAGGSSSIAIYSNTNNIWTYTSVANSLTSGVVAVYSTGGAFAALKSNGSVVTWGQAQSGGNSSIAIYSNDGSTIYTSVANSLTSGVVSIYSAQGAFAALKSDGSVVTWGDGGGGGSSSIAIYSNGSTIYTSVANSLTSGVVSIYSTYYAFAALKNDGSVVTWGNGYGGGNSSVAIYSNANGSYYAGTSVANSLTSGVVSIYSTNYAFAALKSDGSVVTWGRAEYGGDSSIATATYSPYQLAYTSVANSLTSGVVAVYSNSDAFAALKTDGSVVAWGNSSYGGDSSLVASSLLSNVVAVYSNGAAFAALKSNGSVVTWGRAESGGNSSISEYIGPNNTRYTSVSNSLTSGVVAVYSNGGAFAALKSNGSVVTWGSRQYGGDREQYFSGGNYSSLAWVLTSNVVAVYSSGGAFAALKSNGSITPWGSEYSGGFGGYNTNLSQDYIAVYSNSQTFTALKMSFDTTTFDLSFSYYRDIDRYDILRKKENRRRVNLTTLNNNVFTLSAARDLQSFNPTMPTDKVLRVIVPDYTASSYSITSTATIPSGAGSVIIACDEGEPVTISGSTYVNFGSYVYKRETNNTYTKLTTTQIVSGAAYMMYGGDGVNSSGIALVASYTVVVASPKVYGDASFAITTRPTTLSNGAITYTSSNPAVATIDSAGDWINIVSPGTATIIATQAADGEYASFTITSNVLTVNKITPTLALVGVASTVSKYLSDAPFTVAASSASPGLITYTSSNTARATVGLTTGLVTIVAAGSVTITAAQASTTFYSAPTSVTCTITVGAVESLAGQTVTTSLASRNFTGASFASTVLTNISLAGATLTGVNFSGASISGANFTNANIVSATNLPAFSTTQKLQLLRNANNASISAVQITTLLSGTEVNAAITTPIPDIEGATFVVKAPAYDASGVKVVTITSTDVSNNASIYIPMNSGETVKVNGVTYTFDGTNILNASGATVTFVLVLGNLFRLYAGSIVGLNVNDIIDKLNNIKISGYGLYDVLADMYTLKS